MLAFTNNGTTMGNIAASYNSATGVLTLTSSGQTATLAQWDAALQAVTYDDTSHNPNTASRTISFVVNDGTADSVVSTKTVSITAVNTPPSDIIWNASGGSSLPGAGTIVATLTTVDSDNSSGFTYSVVTSSDVNVPANSFTVSSGGTVTAVSALANNTTYALDVQSTDTLGAKFQEVFHIITDDSSGSTLTGTDGPDIIYGLGGNDTITGGAGDDVLIGGTGADTMTGGGGADTFNFAAGDSQLSITGSANTIGSISGYDSITDFTPAATALLSEKLGFSGAAVVTSFAGGNGADSSLWLHTNATVKTHSITSGGIIKFSDATTFAAVSLTSIGDVAAVVQYLQNNDIGTTGSTVAFTATISGVTHTYVYIQGTDTGGDNTKDVLIDVQNVSADSLSASGNQLSLLDTTAPAAPSVTGITTDSGTAGDHITNDTSLTISGTAEANSTVTVFQDGVSIGTATADGSGNWSTADSNVLANGTTYQFTATATDAAGNTSVASTSYAATIDTTAPATTISGIDISADTGTSASDFLTKTAAQTITGTLSAGLVAGEILYGSVNGGGSWTNITGMVSGTVISWTGATLSGSNSIQFKVTDAAGNDGSVASQSYVLDTTAPTVSSVAYGTNDGALAAGETVTLSVTFSENAVVTGAPTLNLNSGGTASYTSGSGTNALTFTYTPAAGESTADLALTASAFNLPGGATITDVAGNTATLTGANSVNPPGTLAVDTTAPSAPTAVTLTPVGGTVVANTVNTTNTNLNISAAIVAGQATGGKAEFYVNGVLKGTDSSIAGGDTSVTFTTSDGTPTNAELQAAIAAGGVVTVKLFDAAGNATTSAANPTLIVDYIAPATTISGIDISADTGTSASDFLTKTAAQTITGTLSAGLVAGEILYGSVNGGGSWTNITGMVSGTVISWTGATLSGSNSIQFKVTDAAGNDGSVASQSYVLDTTAPTVSSVAYGTNDGALAAGETVTLSVTFSENAVVTGAPTLNLNSGGTASYTSGSGTNALTFTYTPAAGESTADLALTASAFNLPGGATITDVAGNTATLTGANSVNPPGTLAVDTTAPSAPTAVTLAPVGGTVVANTVNTTNTNLDISATITAGQATGGKAEFYVNGVLKGTDSSIAGGDTSVTFTTSDGLRPMQSCRPPLQRAVSSPSSCSTPQATPPPVRRIQR